MRNACDCWPIEEPSSLFQNFGMSLHVRVSLWLPIGEAVQALVPSSVFARTLVLCAHLCRSLLRHCPHAGSGAGERCSLFALKRTLLNET
jgi:hypothetical protein